MRFSNSGRVAVVVVSLALFAWLGNGVMKNEFVDFDAQVRNTIHQAADAGLTQFMFWMTNLGSKAAAAVLATVISLWLAARRAWRSMLIVWITLMGEAILESVLKTGFHRSRPVPFFGLPLPDSKSFPSGHAMTGICLYGVTAWLLNGVQSTAVRSAIWISAGVVSLLVGASRVYLGVHYPTDVLAGYAIAIAWLTTVVSVSRTSRSQPSSVARPDSTFC